MPRLTRVPTATLFAEANHRLAHLQSLIPDGTDPRAVFHAETIATLEALKARLEAFLPTPDRSEA